MFELRRLVQQCPMEFIRLVECGVNALMIVKDAESLGRPRDAGVESR